MQVRFRAAAIAAYTLVFAAALAVFSAAPSTAQQTPRFSLPSDASLPVLVMRQRPSELAEDATQEVRIFADGRCSVRRPTSMRGAGEHAWTIAPSEVNDLLSRAVDAGVADIDPSAHRASLRSQAAAAASGDGRFRFDDDTIEFEIRVDAYRAPGRSQRRDVRRTIEWRGLRGDRDRHPNDVPIRLLSELRDELDAMTRTRAPVDAQP